MENSSEYERMLMALESEGPAGRAVSIALRYGQTDGDHHKAWVIDQMLQALLVDDYDRVIATYEHGDDEEDDGCEWYRGIAP